MAFGDRSASAGRPRRRRRVKPAPPPPRSHRLDSYPDAPTSAAGRTRTPQTTQRHAQEARRVRAARREDRRIAGAERLRGWGAEAPAARRAQQHLDHSNQGGGARGVFMALEDARKRRRTATLLRLLHTPGRDVGRQQSTITELQHLGHLTPDLSIGRDVGRPSHTGLAVGGRIGSTVDAIPESFRGHHTSLGSTLSSAYDTAKGLLGDLASRSSPTGFRRPTPYIDEVNDAVGTGVKTAAGGLLKGLSSLASSPSLTAGGNPNLSKQQQAVEMGILPQSVANKITDFKGSSKALAEDAFNQLQRVNHGLANATLYAESGKNPIKGFTRGVTNKEKTYFSDVLQKAGFSGLESGTLGLALDIATDPTTYLTLGTGTAGEIAAKTAMRAAAEREGASLYELTLRAGRGDANAIDALRRVRQAAEHAEAAAPAGRGVKVGFRGAPISTTRRAHRLLTGRPRTYADLRQVGMKRVYGRGAGNGINAAMGQPGLRTMRGAGRRLLEDLSPTYRNPEHFPSHSRFDFFQEIGRIKRTGDSRGVAEAVAFAAKYKRELSRLKWNNRAGIEEIARAIETRDFSRLPEKVAKVAREMDEGLAHYGDEIKRSGLMKTLIGDHVDHPLVPGTHVDLPDLREVNAEAFTHHFEKAYKGPRGAFLSPYNVAERDGQRMFVAEHGRIGGALKAREDGGLEIVSLFNHGGTRGAGTKMAEHLIAEAKATGKPLHLDAIGPKLEKSYGDLGFTTTNRLKWDDKYAPEGWNYDEWGRPDIVEMSYDPARGTDAGATGRDGSAAGDALGGSDLRAGAEPGGGDRAAQLRAVWGSEGSPALGAGVARGAAAHLHDFDLEAARRAVRRAHTDVGRAQRELDSAREARGYFQGRAERGSLAVTGTKAGERRGTAAGQHGVRQAAERYRRAEDRLANAKAAAAEAEQHLKEWKTLANQRAQGLKRSAQLEAEPQGFFPRTMQREMDTSQQLTSGQTLLRMRGSTGTSTRADFMSTRGRRVPLHEMTPTERSDYYLEDIGPILSSYVADVKRSVNNREWQNLMAAAARPIKTYEDFRRVANLPHFDGEAAANLIYVRTKEGYRRLIPADRGPLVTEERLAARIGRVKGDLYVIPSHEFEFAREVATRSAGAVTETGHLSRAYDRVLGQWKGAMTVLNPSYHPVNFIGDVGWLGRRGGLTTNDVRRTLRPKGLMHYVAELTTERDPQKLFLRFEELADKGKVHTYPNGIGKLSEGQVAWLALHFGGVQTGLAGHELRALEHALSEGRFGASMRVVRRLNELRENVGRAALYERALRMGKDPLEAASWVNHHLYDYSNLTTFERNAARRLFGFWTFMARNLPGQVRTLTGRPGMYASLGKVQGEAAKAAGLDPDFYKQMADYQQAGIPLPLGVKVGGMPLLTYLRLPATDLNQLTPTDSSIQQLVSRMTPPLRMALEQGTGINFFFRERYKDHVPAPNGVQLLPKAIQDALGVGWQYNAKLGRRVPSWSWRVDELFRAVPQTNIVANVATPGRSQHTTTPALSLLSALGPRTTTFDPVFQARTRLAGEFFDNQRKLDDLSQQRDPNNPDPGVERRYDALSERQKKLTADLQELDAALGYKHRFGERRARRGRPSTKPWGSSTGSGAVWGSGSSSTGATWGGG